MKTEETKEIPNLPLTALRLKTLRLKRNWTLMKTSETSGVSVAFLSRIETGKQMPSIKTLIKLADAFNTTTDFLLGRRELQMQDFLADPKIQAMIRGIQTFSEADKTLFYEFYKFIIAKYTGTDA